MAVTQFEVGKYYRWIGPKDFNVNWNRDKEAWKDGKSRKCKETPSPGWGVFGNIRNGAWYYGHCLQYFEEVGMYYRGDLVSIPASLCIPTPTSIKEPFQAESKASIRKRLLGI